MFLPKTTLLLACAGAVIICTTFGQKHKTKDTQCEANLPECGICGRRIDVTVIARNLLVEPNFEFRANFTDKPQRELIYFLQDAVELDSGFKFKARYSATVHVGYFIEEINGLAGSIPNETFWHIFSSNTGTTQCGVSGYVPKDGETILFNYTTYDEAFGDRGH